MRLFQNQFQYQNLSWVMLAVFCVPLAAGTNIVIAPSYTFAPAIPRGELTIISFTTLQTDLIDSGTGGRAMDSANLVHLLPVTDSGTTILVISTACPVDGELPVIDQIPIVVLSATSNGGVQVDVCMTPGQRVPLTAYTVVDKHVHCLSSSVPGTHGFEAQYPERGIEADMITASNHAWQDSVTSPSTISMMPTSLLQPHDFGDLATFAALTGWVPVNSRSYGRPSLQMQTDGRLYLSPLITINGESSYGQKATTV